LSAIASLRHHWPEYLMELGGRGCYLFGACVFATVLQHPVSDSTTDCRSNPIAHRVRRKRQRLPPSLLIENASDRDPARPQNLPEAFPIKASDHSPEAGCCRSEFDRSGRGRRHIPHRASGSVETLTRGTGSHGKANRAAVAADLDAALKDRAYPPGPHGGIWCPRGSALGEPAVCRPASDTAPRRLWGRQTR